MVEHTGSSSGMVRVFLLRVSSVSQFFFNLLLLVFKLFLLFENAGIHFFVLSRCGVGTHA